MSLYLFQLDGEWFVQFEDEDPSDGMPTRERAVAFMENEFPGFSYVEGPPPTSPMKLHDMVQFFRPGMKPQVLQMIQDRMLLQATKYHSVPIPILSAPSFPMTWGKQAGGTRQIALSDYVDWQHDRIFRDYRLTQAEIDMVRQDIRRGGDVWFEVRHDKVVAFLGNHMLFVKKPQ